MRRTSEIKMGSISLRNAGLVATDTLFSNLNFVVADGDRVGLVAGNGRGKTTLLRAMAGQGELTAGDIVRSRGLQVGYVEQAKRAAQRTFLPGSEDGGFGQNDVAPPTFLAWRAQEEAGACLEACLAILAAVASQALYVTERPAPPALTDLLDSVRSAVPPVTGSRAIGPGLAVLTAALHAEIYDVAPSVAD